ncbi:MAG: hypothetical protein WCS69_06415 [Ignavibacteriaceae bacterium]|jgi:hypothetical protein
MKKIVYVFALFSSLLSINCKFSNPTASPYSKIEIFPLNLNNSWNYTCLHYSLNSDNSIKGLIDSSEIIMEVVKTDSMDSFKGYYVKNLIVNTFPALKMLLKNENDGLYIASVDELLTTSPRHAKVERVLKYPTADNDSSTFAGYTIKTKSSSEKITINNRTYACVLYDVYQSSGIVAQFWMIPNIGIVKTWQYFGYTMYEFKLNSYTLN